MSMDPLETDEEQVADERDETPVDLATEAATPATVAYVKRELVRAVRKHGTQCFAQRSVRRWRLWIAGGVGAIMVLQFGWLLAGRAIIRETVRDVVREELAGRMVARASSSPLPGVISQASAAEAKP